MASGEQWEDEKKFGTTASEMLELMKNAEPAVRDELYAHVAAVMEHYASQIEEWPLEMSSAAAQEGARQAIEEAARLARLLAKTARDQMR